MQPAIQRDLSDTSIEKAQVAEKEALKVISYNRAIANGDIATAELISGDIKSNIGELEALSRKRINEDKVENEALAQQIYHQAKLKDASVSKVMIDNKLLNLNTEQKKELKKILPTLDKDEIQQIMWEDLLNSKADRTSTIETNIEGYKLIDKLAIKQKDSKSEITVWEHEVPEIEFVEDKTRRMLTIKNKVTNTVKQYHLTDALYSMLKLQPTTMKEQKVLLLFPKHENERALQDYVSIQEEIETVSPKYFDGTGRSKKLQFIKKAITNIKSEPTTASGDVPQQLYLGFEPVKPEPEPEPIIDIPVASSRVKRETKLESKNDSESTPSKGKKKRGKGIAVDPKIPFGKFLIDRKKLMRQNILSISDQRGLKVNGFPNISVSDNMVKFFTRKQLNTKKYNLTDVEQQLISRLMNRANAEIGVSKSKLIKEDSKQIVNILKNEMEVVCGELNAGNDNPELKNQLADILKKLLLLGAITKEMARRIAREFISDV